MRATPEFDFGLSEQTLMLRDTVARFADERIAPIAARIDVERSFRVSMVEFGGAWLRNVSSMART